ncbi:unnamed protein product [Larinioides sclopetarius]|uniref:Uncharacterized protein n=1 Tax=Larinioides sclopetarius TaxID=280406 RepID=A0AAV1ZUA6_9ARAC
MKLDTQFSHQKFMPVYQFSPNPSEETSVETRCVLQAAVVNKSLSSNPSKWSASK